MTKRLMDSTIRVIAREGMDRATTKAIATGAEANEVYIYRIFDDKVDLLVKTFATLDAELLEEVEKSVALAFDGRGDFFSRGKDMFLHLWKFLLGSSDKTLCFVQYYYSPYFRKFSAEEHKERYAGVVGILSKLFRDEANVWMILNHILNVLLDFATKVHYGDLPDDNDSETHVYFVLYNSIKPYLREGIE